MIKIKTKSNFEQSKIRLTKVVNRN